MTDNIYFQGFFFKQNNINSLDEAKEFINTMFDTLLDNDINIIFLNNYNNFYFKTNSVKDDDVINLYQNILFDADDNIRNNIFINHFFRINNKFNHIELYKIISNIENIKRLLVAFTYYLTPNLIYHKKSDIIIGNDINKYSEVFLEFDKQILDFGKFIRKYKDKKRKATYDWLDNIFKEYLELEKIINKIRKEEDTDKLYNIRGAIAHNKMFKKYGDNLKIENLLNYQEDTETCEIIYKELYNLLKELLEKNKYDELNMQIN